MASLFNSNPWLINTYDSTCAKNGVHILKLVAREAHQLWDQRNKPKKCVQNKGYLCLLMFIMDVVLVEREMFDAGLTEQNPTLFRMSSSANSPPSIPSLVQCKVAAWNAWNKLGQCRGCAENKQRTSQRHLCGSGAEQESSSQECEKKKTQVYSKNLHAKVIFNFLFPNIFASVYPLFSGFIQSLWLQLFTT